MTLTGPFFTRRSSWVGLSLAAFADKTRIFVYGTLRRGEVAHKLLANASFIGEGRTTAHFQLLDLGDYPGMTEGGMTSVMGEVYEVDETLLGVLDRYEGYPELYDRKTIHLEEGGSATTYLLRVHGGEVHPIIASGDWLQRR